MQSEEKLHQYCLGKASLIAGLMACLLSFAYWIWHWAWICFGFYKSFTGDLSEIGLLLVGVSVFVTPFLWFWH